MDHQANVAQLKQRIEKAQRKLDKLVLLELAPLTRNPNSAEYSESENTKHLEGLTPDNMNELRDLLEHYRQIKKLIRDIERNKYYQGPVIQNVFYFLGVFAIIIGLITSSQYFRATPLLGYQVLLPNLYGGLVLIGIGAIIKWLWNSRQS